MAASVVCIQTTIMPRSHVLHLQTTNNGTFCLLSSINPLSYLSLIICKDYSIVMTSKKLPEIIEPYFIELSGFYWEFVTMDWKPREFHCLFLCGFCLVISKLLKPYEATPVLNLIIAFRSETTFCGQTACILCLCLFWLHRSIAL